MASKLEGNGLWDSSKFMLPEHVETLKNYEKEQQRKLRKNLADHELERINRALHLSLQHRVQISISMYDPFEELCVVGIVESMSKLYGQFRVGDDWFLVDDIQAIKIDDDRC